MARPEKARLGEILVQQKLLTQDQLKLALDEQKRSGRKLGRVFIEQGFVTEEEISEALAKQLQIPYINLKYYNIKSEITQKLPETQARRFRAILLEDNAKAMKVGLADPTDLNAYDEIARVVSRLTRVPLAANACRRVRDNTPQASLPWNERAKNIRGAFVCDADLSGLRVAVIDDVMTTGATLNELARNLRQAGTLEIQGWMVARALPH